MNDKIIPFGKYKGQPIEAILEDTKYVELYISEYVGKGVTKEQFVEIFHNEGIFVRFQKDLM